MGETDLHLGGQQSSRGETKRGRQRRRDRDGETERHRDRERERERERQKDTQWQRQTRAERQSPREGADETGRGATLRPAAQLRTHP